MSMKYLKIENPGVCPPEGFTLFGATTKRGATQSPYTIGTFGSGNKHSTCLLLRCGIKPTVFCSYLRMQFYTQPVKITGVGGSVSQQQVCVKYGGRDQEGHTCTKTQELSMTLGYGTQDWSKVQLALREYVSNALDACFEVGMDVVQARNTIKVEIVGEHLVEARRGFTRIFVPLTPEVQDFYTNRNKWFLHFREPELVTQKILPKANRNVSAEKKVPMIYRRGVFVREFLSTNKASLYDYNLNDLQLDESRVATDWDVKHACGQAIADADLPVMTRVLSEVISNNTNCWEATLDESSLSSGYVNSKVKEPRRSTMLAAYEAIAGPDGVLMDNRHANVADLVRRKGFNPTPIESLSWLETCKYLGVRTDEQVLTQDDRDGTVYSEATSGVQGTLNWVWELILEFDMTCGKLKPEVGCFFRHRDAGQDFMGLYKDGKVLVHTDHAVPGELLKTIMMHEVGHHCTGATDGSYDFNVWFNRFCVRMGTRLTQR